MILREYLSKHVITFVLFCFVLFLTCNIGAEKLF